MTESFGEIKGKILDSYYSLSKREQYIVLGVGLALVLFALFSIVQGVIPIFTNQSKVISQLEEDVEKLPMFLVRYSQLKNNLSKIESQFNSPQGNEGVKGYLASIAQSAKIGETPKIETLATQKLGTRFERTPYTISFNATDLSTVVSLLEKIVKGNRPLLLADLEINKNSRNLRVEVGLSSITPIN